MLATTCCVAFAASLVDPSERCDTSFFFLLEEGGREGGGWREGERGWRKRESVWIC